MEITGDNSFLENLKRITDQVVKKAASFVKKECSLYQRQIIYFNLFLCLSLLKIFQQMFQ
jgi:hypothetical protein